MIAVHVVGCQGPRRSVEGRFQCQSCELIPTIIQMSAREGKRQNPFVLIIATGGTIAMKMENGVLVPDEKGLIEHIENSPVLNDKTFHPGKHPLPDLDGQVFATPIVPRLDNVRVEYFLHEYKTFIDSSNITISDFKEMAQSIQECYSFFDGIVILHGTDTMAYSSSYLSFMLENFPKTAILTGAQLPLFDPRSDGIDNILGALCIAAKHVIPGVSLFFDQQLYRGNRVRKFNNQSFSAFRSLNLESLLEMGVKIIKNTIINQGSLFTESNFKLHLQMEENVGLLPLFPSLTAATLKAFLSPPMKGVVLHTYGTGNGPTGRKDFMKVLIKANEREVLMINCTQCDVGSVMCLYATGKGLEEAGVVPGYDITPEAALAKLSFVLGKPDLTFEQQKAELRKNLRGEITIPRNDRE